MTLRGISALIVTVVLLGSAACDSDTSSASPREDSTVAAGAAAPETPTQTASTAAHDDETEHYTSAQRDLLNHSRVDWTGDPGDLFATADAVCAAYNKGPKTVEQGVDAADDLVTKGRWLARLFFVDVATTVCTPNTPAKRAAVEHEDALLRYVDRINNAGLGNYVDDVDIRADAAEFCSSAATGATYNDIAARIRKDYFDRETRVKAYIATAFKTVCPSQAVAYTPPPPPPPKTTFGEGIWLVGRDIAPGTYRATGVRLCYWERLSGLGGGFGDIIANDNITSGQAIVAISPYDKAFSSNRCGTWHKIG